MGVSVVLPCRNVAPFVEAAVASAYRQSLAPSEVICVNDGSDDGTPAVLRACQRRHPNLIVIDQPARGACAARNAGLGRATAEWIQFLDGDDILLPDKLNGQLARGSASPGADVVVGSYLEVDLNLAVIRQVVERPSPDAWIALMTSRAGRTSSLLWRRQAVVDAGGWKESQESSQEYELMFRLLQRGGRFVFDERPLTQVRRRPSGAITSTKVADNARRFLVLRCEVFERLSAGDYPHQAALRQALFASIRLAYSYDSPFAVAALQKYLPPPFVPQTSRLYALVYRLFGIDGAEGVSQAIAALTGRLAARGAE